MDDGRTLTYRRARGASNQLAHLFRAAGLRRGDHIAFVLENRPEVFVVAWAAQRAGPLLHGGSTRLGVDELQYIVDDCGARVLIASAATLPTPPQRRGARRSSCACSSTAPPTAGSRSTPPSPPTRRRPSTTRPRAPTCSTARAPPGRPKGVKVPLPSGDVPAARRRSAASRRMLFGADQDTVYLSPAPLYHAAPLRFTMAAQRLGATVVVMEHFDPERFLAPRRAAPGHLHPGRADDVHPDAEAARRGAGQLRPVVARRPSSTPPPRARSR